MTAVMLAVLLLVCVCDSTAFRLTGNIALRAETHQSTDLLNGVSAWRAVAGDGDQSCSSISSKRSPWWRVSLAQTYRIAKISISTSAEGINGAEIRIGSSLEEDGNHNQLVARVFSVQPGKAQVFRFRPVEGRFVNVILPGVDRVLNLCEVEVFALTQDSNSELVNVAVSGRATQSSVRPGSAACLSLPQNAIDGNRQYDPSRGSCAQTDTESAPWWRLDLLRTHTITAVALTRGDQDVSGARVTIGDSLQDEGRANTLCVSVSFIPAGGTGRFRCVSALRGRYVTVALAGENRTLSLCEVEVFGGPDQ
ncbi:uncharacterized protein si:ch1073-376c22.1 [Danio aesculapii]|uniref:uncharacterized protein si:ch1073-376c22.1 n=1 Tax=Danio aesculapii TaxID=1142201 RepID=UPI0024C011DC|nr:uncharacterized protein si:ch1073-376c22.1 [Danio aesculapii]